MILSLSDSGLSLDMGLAALTRGLELAGGHHGGYSASFVSKHGQYTRECPPEGQGTPSGTGSPPPSRPPPYAPSGSYLRVLLIFSYYRRACGVHTHVLRTGTECTLGHRHAHARKGRTCTCGPPRGLLGPPWRLRRYVLSRPGTPICESTLCIRVRSLWYVTLITLENFFAGEQNIGEFQFLRINDGDFNGEDGGN